MIELKVIPIIYGRRFYIISTKDDIAFDVFVMEYLGINYEEYKNISLKYGAINVHDRMFFRNEEDCLLCLNSDEFLPYLMMKKLGE